MRLSVPYLPCYGRRTFNFTWHWECGPVGILFSSAQMIGFEVLTAVTIKIMILYVVMPRTCLKMTWGCNPGDSTLQEL
jgi:hypothetical protein